MDFSEKTAGTIVDHACHDAGISDTAFFNSKNLCLIEGAFMALHQMSGIGVADAMTESAEAAIWLKVGHCADSLCVVANPGAEHAGAIGGSHRTHRDLKLLIVTPDF